MAFDLSSLAAGGLSDSGVSVTFRSLVTPPLNIVSPSASSAATGGAGATNTGSGGTGAGGFAAYLKPAVDILGPDGSVITTIAPYGDPGNGLTGALVLGSVVFTLFALAFLAGAKWG